MKAKKISAERKIMSYSSIPKLNAYASWWYIIIIIFIFLIFPDVESGEYKIHVMRVRSRKTRTICSINELGKRDAANRLVVSDTATKL